MKSTFFLSAKPHPQSVVVPPEHTAQVKIDEVKTRPSWDYSRMVEEVWKSIQTACPEERREGIADRRRSAFSPAGAPLPLFGGRRAATLERRAEREGWGLGVSHRYLVVPDPPDRRNRPGFRYIDSPDTRIRSLERRKINLTQGGNTAWQN